MSALTADDRALIRELANPALPLERIAEARAMSLADLRERLRTPALRAEVAASRALARLRAELIAGEARVAALARLHIHAVDEPASHTGADRIPWYARESSRKSAALLLRAAPAPTPRRHPKREQPRQEPTPPHDPAPTTRRTALSAQHPASATPHSAPSIAAGESPWRPQHSAPPQASRRGDRSTHHPALAVPTTRAHTLTSRAGLNPHHAAASPLADRLPDILVPALPP